MSRRCLIALIPLVAVLGTPASPAAAFGRSSTFRPSIWLPYWNMSTAVSDVSANADLFSTASMFSYDATSCSTIAAQPGAGNRTQIATLRRHGIHVVATVTASGLTPRHAISCFGNADTRRAHVRSLVRLAKSRAYAGIDIDYENLALTTSRAQALRVRAAFSAFGRDLCAALRAAGKRCNITVMPRTSDALTVWRGKLIPGVYDYAVLGAAASRLRVMAYDQHAGGYGPGPIAGYPWVRRIVAYTATKVRLGKVELGVPLYGRDFAGGSSVPLLQNQASALARRYGKSSRWDPVQKERTFRYRAHGVTHTVWFSSPHAVMVRTRLAVHQAMAGTAYWAAGEEPSGTWSAVRRG